MRLRNSAMTIVIGVVLGVGSFVLLQNRTNPRIAAVLPVQGASVGTEPAFILPVSQTTYLPIRDFSIPDPQMQARAVLLVDLRSNRVLFAKSSDQHLPIASITKLMSAMIILDHLDMSATYIVSAEDLNLDGNGADFTKGEQFKGTELFKIMLIKSSNDAVSVFAKAAHEKGLEFVDLMNQKARELGMLDTHFADPEGLNDRETNSTAVDVAKLVRAAMHSSLIAGILITKEADIPTMENKPYHVVNTDQLLGTIANILIGKTGNTDGALGTLTLAVKVGDQGDGLIGVILGSKDRFGEMKTLIDWGKRAHRWLP